MLKHTPSKWQKENTSKCRNWASRTKRHFRTIDHRSIFISYCPETSFVFCKTCRVSTLACVSLFVFRMQWLCCRSDECAPQFACFSIFISLFLCPFLSCNVLSSLSHHRNTKFYMFTDLLLHSWVQDWIQDLFYKSYVYYCRTGLR